MVDISAAGSSESAGGIRVGKRSYFSTHHLYAARYAAEDAQIRETSLTGGGDRFDVRHRGLVLTAITESAFFLEAAINEIFQDAADGHTHSLDMLSELCRSAMAAVWKATNNGYLEPLAKYDLALRLAKREAFDSGAEPYQNALRLIKLRNTLAHYRPETIYSDTSHRDGKHLVGRFPPNALMGPANLWFPDRALGAGCANWAWRSATALTEEFSRRMGISMNYQVADFEDPLPE